ncbi:ComF family protein [Marisediminicola senii]|uniref:ComF family protein n=1 Tax=Marisediminicola senii TaxID=2711233 RepID=UPI0013EB5C35|nr:phosphoribosyltransferase family protein [Marisediminicola senii]
MRKPFAAASTRDAIRAAVIEAWSVLSPVECAGCGVPDHAVCPTCRGALDPQPTHLALPSPHHSTGAIPVVSALRYDGAVRRVILALKEQGRTDVARALAAPLAAAVTIAATEARGEVRLVTVPRSRSSYRRRGYDPVSLVLRRTGLPRPVAALRWTRRTGAQKALDVTDRGANLAGSLAARWPLDAGRFVLVDDVTTTGSTIREAARAVREAGGEVVTAATIAFVPKLVPERST